MQIDDGGSHLADELQQLLLESRFGNTVIERFRSPLAFLDFLRLGLAIALARNDVVQTWRYVNRHREVLQKERLPERVVAYTQAGNFEAALDNTSLYADMPNSQQMFRLWIAWHAATSGQSEIATQAAAMALGGLPLRGFLSKAAGEADPASAMALLDAQSIALQHVLIRVARSIADSSPDTLVLCKTRPILSLRAK